MGKFYFESPDSIFYKVPAIEDICIEYGIDKTNVETISCMYELFKRVTDKDSYVWDEESYNEGYENGWNDAIEKAEDKIEDAVWEIGGLKK